MFRLQSLPLLPAGKLDLASERFHLCGDFLGLLLPFLDRAVACEDCVLLPRRAEVRLEAVVVDLADRIEHVIVAPRATDSKPQERRADDVRALGEDFVATGCDFLVAGVAANRSQPMQASGGEHGLVRFETRAALGHFVTRDLLADEPIESDITIEGVDHVVAVSPEARQVAVVFESLGFGVPHHVEPALGGPLALPRAGQKPVHKPLP